jgi:hypothetical protein
MAPRIYLGNPPTCLNRDNLHPDDLSLLRYPIVQTHRRWFRNFNLIPIAYAFRPRLRGRLTLSGLALLRKPWVFGGEVSRLSYRYSYRHNLFHFVQRPLRITFTLQWNAPLPSRLRGIRSFGNKLESHELSARTHLTSELLRFL